MFLRVAAVALLCVALGGGVAHAKKYDICGLYKALKAEGFAEKDLRNWVCLVMAESGGNTARRGPKNSNGSYDYGLFQINSKYWCGISKAGGDCNVRCSALLDDDISNDSVCAKKIFARHGFPGWYGWRNKCKGKPLPDLSKCT